jgi:hypothetical protein
VARMAARESERARRSYSLGSFPGAADQHAVGSAGRS